MIAFPLAGHIKAAGITPQALENLLRARLQKNYTGKLDITVSLAAVNPTEAADTKPRVYISGEVLKPGPYPPNRHHYRAGDLACRGVKSLCGSKRIQIHRQINGADTVIVFDYKAFQAGTNVTENFTLQSGDVVIVPERGLLE